jgi:uncharacterized oligopeptide transporter (OPT) family protein
MYALHLLSTPKADFGKLLGLGVVCSFYGMFFAIPLRKFYILRQRLIFPDATAVSISIRTLHSSAEKARTQIYALCISFAASFTWSVCQGYASCVMEYWHFFWWISRFAGPGILAAHNWGWGTINLSSCFFGLGIIIGLNGALSWYLGSIIAWGIIGPITVATGATSGRDLGDYQVSYMASKYGSPRYWLLWPGVLIMLCASLAEVAIKYKVIGGGIKAGCLDLYNLMRKRPPAESDDPVKAEDQVPLWAWLSGLVASMVLSCVLLKVQFQVSVGNTILAIVLAFIFSFVGVQASGTVGMNPVGPIGKCSQLIFGGISKLEGQNLHTAQTANIIAGSLAGQAASHSVDMTADLKIGHLMSATPKGQFWAQLVGTTVAIVPMTGLFVVFTTAYPCIIDHDIESCPFQMPAVMAWKMVAIAMTSKISPIPFGSGITAIVFAIVASLTVVVRSHFPKKYHPYVPNWVAIGLGFVIPQASLAFALVCGALGAFLVKKYKPTAWEKYGYPVAAGMTAGEACSGLLIAGLVIAGVDGGTKGTEFGCPFQ